MDIGRQKNKDVADINVGDKSISCVHENDLISRQQAIDALTEYGNGRAVFISVGEAVIRIEQLPSAQPTFDARDTQYNLQIGTDLISRRAMIEAIENNDNFVGGSYDIIKVVKSLPPAEPERTPMQELLDVTADRDYWKAQCHSYEMTINRLTESAQPKTGKWILDRSGAYCCSECMEPCAGYVMMKPRDKFCKMCGSRNEVTR